MADPATPQGGTDILSLMDTFTKQVTSSFTAQFDGLNKSMKESDKRMEKRLDRLDGTMQDVRDKVLLHDERLTHGARSFDDIRSQMSWLEVQVKDVASRPATSPDVCAKNSKALSTVVEEVATIKARNEGEKETKRDARDTVKTAFAGLGVGAAVSGAIIALLKLLWPVLSSGSTP